MWWLDVACGLYSVAVRFWNIGAVNVELLGEDHAEEKPSVCQVGPIFLKRPPQHR